MKTSRRDHQENFSAAKNIFIFCGPFGARVNKVNHMQDLQLIPCTISLASDRKDIFIFVYFSFVLIT